jgi:hypothetical protein
MTGHFSRNRVPDHDKPHQTAELDLQMAVCTLPTSDRAYFSIFTPLAKPEVLRVGLALQNISII